MKHRPRKYIHGILGGLVITALAILLTGCATCDPAKYIERHCPVKRVYGEASDHVVRNSIYFDDKHCYMVGNCWRDSIAIARWAQAQGIPCTTLPEAVKVGRRIITGGHVYVVPDGSAYYLDYVDTLGIVRYRK